MPCTLNLFLFVLIQQIFTTCPPLGILFPEDRTLRNPLCLVDFHLGSHIFHYSLLILTLSFPLLPSDSPISLRFLSTLQTDAAFSLLGLPSLHSKISCVFQYPMFLHKPQPLLQLLSLLYTSCAIMSTIISNC